MKRLLYCITPSNSAKYHWRRATESTSLRESIYVAENIFTGSKFSGSAGRPGKCCLLQEGQTCGCAVSELPQCNGHVCLTWPKHSKVILLLAIGKYVLFEKPGVGVLQINPGDVNHAQPFWLPL